MSPSNPSYEPVSPCLGLFGLVIVSWRCIFFFLKSGYCLQKRASQWNDARDCQQRFKIPLKSPDSRISGLGSGLTDQAEPSGAKGSGGGGVEGLGDVLLWRREPRPNVLSDCRQLYHHSSPFLSDGLKQRNKIHVTSCLLTRQMQDHRYQTPEDLNFRVI